MRLEKKHFPIPAALLAGCAAAFVTLLIPIEAIENFTASSGLSEMIPQTAPPLGTTARMGIAFVAAIVVAGIVLALLGSGADQDAPTRRRAAPEPEDRNGPALLRMPRFGGIRRSAVVSREPPAAPAPMAAAAPSESRFARIKRKLDALAGRDVGSDGIAASDESGQRPRGIRNFDDLPKWRSADRHPDHPPRPPIMASADLGDPDDRFPPAEPLPAAPPAEPIADRAIMRDEDVFEDDALAGARPVPVAPRAAEPANWRPLGAATPEQPADRLSLEELPMDADMDGPTQSDAARGQDQSPAADDSPDENFHANERPYADLDVDDLIDRLERRLSSATLNPALPEDRESPAAVQDDLTEEEETTEPVDAAPPASTPADRDMIDPTPVDPVDPIDDALDDSGPADPEPAELRPADFGPAAVESGAPVYRLDNANRAPAAVAPRLVTVSAEPDLPDDANDEMDEALRAALETLERMNQRRA